MRGEETVLAPLRPNLASVGISAVVGLMSAQTRPSVHVVGAVSHWPTVPPHASKLVTHLV
jgi:hypothetical protein